MKKLAMLILLAVFAAASVTACSKDKKDDNAEGDKAKDGDKDKKGDPAAKGADTDENKTDEAASGTTTERMADDEGEPEGDEVEPEEAEPEEAEDDGEAKDIDTNFDEAFAKEAMTAFEGFIKIMEANKDDCPKMAKELEAYMKKNQAIKDRIDAIQDDPEQSKKWNAMVGDQEKAIEARIMPALEGCMEDPAMEAVFNGMK